MRVANIIEEGRMGGPQNRMLQVAIHLHGDVETVMVIPEENSAQFQQRCKENNVSFFAVPLTRISKNWQTAWRYSWRSLWEILLLVRLIRKEHFDVVHVSGGSWQYKGAIAGWLAGIPVLWHLNDSSMPWLFRKLFGIFSRLATGYIYASERTKSYYQPYVKEKRLEVTIPAPVNTRYFDPSLELPVDDLNALLVGKKVVGTVANVSRIKGLEIFLHMASTLQKLHDGEIAFVVVGEIFPSQQDYYQSLQTLAQDLEISNLYWSGSRQDVRPLLQRFDVYVCSSLAESSPLSVWESMSMANPIVSTDVGDVSLYVKEGRNGFVVPVGNYLLLADQVENILIHDEQRKIMGLESREMAIQQLDLTRCAQSHLEAYQRVISI